MDHVEAERMGRGGRHDGTADEQMVLNRSLGMARGAALVDEANRNRQFQSDLNKDIMAGQSAYAGRR